jgi:NTP pyrophosphatase (non-canonical NTP hydrolase)
MTTKNTDLHYKEIVDKCKSIFLKKSKDYGTSWTILRLSSLTDQLFIKAKRIRNIEISNVNKVGDSIEDEFMSIINYCIMAMIKCEEVIEEEISLSNDRLQMFYDKYYIATFELMQKKNTDYGEVWRDMRVSSFTDLILTKLLRIKQIEDNMGKTEVSEGAFSNYQDIMNYSIFAIIKLESENQ